jgi:hypothetical protein
MSGGPPTPDPERRPGSARVEFCGEEYQLQPGDVFTIGREGDLVIDANPFLHRRFLQLGTSEGLWWLANVGSQLTVTLSSPVSSVHAWLAPGARIPLVFPTTSLWFTAGPTTYEIGITVEGSPYESVTWGSELPTGSTTTMNMVDFTPEQLRVILALSEPVLLGTNNGTSQIPTSADAAKRLGWTLTKFNRKLDTMCEKLERRGIRGLRGGSDRLAVNRRARLVEIALSTHLVKPEDLALLDPVPEEIPTY